MPVDCIICVFFFWFSWNNDAARGFFPCSVLFCAGHSRLGHLDICIVDDGDDVNGFVLFRF